MVCVGIVWIKVGPQVRNWWRKKKEKEEELNFGEEEVIEAGGKQEVCVWGRGE